MANTYTQLIIQLVFAVKFREAMINENIRPQIERYIAGIIKSNNHVLLAQYCMPNHCHILIGLNPVQSISDLAKDIKSNSSKWINEQNLTPFKFNWQEGYGAFSYSKSQLDTVVNYILNQKEHHRKRTFKEEYLEFLKKFKVDYKTEYLFDWIEQ
jgi:REP element-mobilizing transposase RayT